MASEAEEVFVESDFLFGLRKSDRLHKHVMEVLEKHHRGDIRISILSSAVMEVRATLYSKSHAVAEVEEIVSLMDTILASFDVNSYIPIALADVVLAERLRSEFLEFTYFDSLHAATAKRHDKRLLSWDKIYTKAKIRLLTDE